MTDETCWVHKIFEQLGPMKNASDSVKAEIWMTYRNKIREQFGIHRATVTSLLKKRFVKGMLLRMKILNLANVILTLYIPFLHFYSN